VAFARLKGARLLYVVHTRQLQEQLARDFPAAVIMGRANYPTANASHLACDACELRPGRRHCPHCCSPGCQGETPHCDAAARCPYLRARREAEQADMAVTNTAYLLQDLEAGGSLADGCDLVVIDEVDELPAALVQHLALEIAPTDLELLQLPPPQDPLSIREWSLWVQAALAVLPERADALSRQLDEGNDPGERAQLALRLRRLEVLLPRLERLAEDDPFSWVASCDDLHRGPFLLRPLWPARYTSSLLWSRLEGRVLFMSATVLDAAALARELGLRQGSWAFLSLPSPIPPERRPVRYIPVASLSHDNTSASWPRAVAALDEVLALHPHERGVVHTQSYRLARYVLERSCHRGRLVGHSSAGERGQALAGHGARRGAVLVSPSMQRGWTSPATGPASPSSSRCPSPTWATPGWPPASPFPTGKSGTPARRSAPWCRPAAASAAAPTTTASPTSWMPSSAASSGDIATSSRPGSWPPSPPGKATTAPLQTMGGQEGRLPPAGRLRWRQKSGAPRPLLPSPQAIERGDSSCS